jgi:hypothetical protein
VTSLIFGNCGQPGNAIGVVVLLDMSGVLYSLEFYFAMRLMTLDQDMMQVAKGAAILEMLNRHVSLFVDGWILDG